MTDQVTTKVCSKCKVEKEFEFFTKDKSRKNGVGSICKICNKEKSKAWCEDNPEKVRAYKKAWYEANPEKLRAAEKAYREANPEKVRAAEKAYREANPEKVRACKKAYREANPEKARAAVKAYREANPEKVRAAEKAYRDRYPDAYVAKAFQCPQELIELKRINLLIKREIRNQQQCQN